MKIPMDGHLIAQIVSDTQIRNSAVTASAASRVAEALKGRFGEHQLSQADLENLAGKLIEDMVPDSPSSEA
jgi:hypothetical protein